MQNTKSQIIVWVLLTRPKTLLAGIGPVILGLAISYSFAQTLNYSLALNTLFCAVLLQISSNLINDYYDGIRGIDGTNRLGPERATAKGLIAPEKIKVAFLFTLSLAFLSGLSLMLKGGPPIIIIGISSLIFAWAYTAGPFPLSYYAMGELFAFLFFGPIAVWGTVYLQLESINNHQNQLVLYSSLVPGLISAALMAVNNLRDIESDRLTRKKTLAIYLGEKGGRLLIIAFVALSALIPLVQHLSGKSYIFILPAFMWVPFYPIWKKVAKGKIDKSFNLVLAKTGAYLFLCTSSYALSYILTTFQRG